MAGESVIEGLTWSEKSGKPSWRKWWVSRNLKAEEELLGEEGGKFSRQRTSEYSMSKELKGSQCAWDAESKGKRGAGNRGKWRLHCEALIWHRKRHKINVNFPSLDFPSSLISKDLEKSWKKKIDHPHWVEYYSRTNSDELSTLATMWMNFKHFMQNERRQIQKAIIGLPWWTSG